MKENYEENEFTQENELDSNAPEKLDNNAEIDNLSEDFENDFDKLQNQYDELNNNYLRLHAEFDNFRKRTLKEKADLIKGGGEKVLSEILPLIDDFDRAILSMKEAEDKDSLMQGMDLIYAKFINFLQQHGVKEIEAVGETFDPDKFEALTTIPVQDKSQSGKVVDCIQKGYTLNDKIIRFPKVIVGE